MISKEMLSRALNESSLRKLGRVINLEDLPHQYPLLVDEESKDLFLQRYPTADDFICSMEFKGIGSYIGEALNLINAAEIYIAYCKMNSAQKCLCLVQQTYDDNICYGHGLCIGQLIILSVVILPELTSLKEKLDALKEKLQPTTLARRCFLALLEHGITAEGRKKLSHIFVDDIKDKEVIDKMPVARLNAVVGVPAPSTSSALQPPPPSYPAPPRPLAPFYPAPQPPENHAPQLGPKI